MLVHHPPILSNSFVEAQAGGLIVAEAPSLLIIDAAVGQPLSLELRVGLLTSLFLISFFFQVGKKTSLPWKTSSDSPKLNESNDSSIVHVTVLS